MAEIDGDATELPVTVTSTATTKPGKRAVKATTKVKVMVASRAATTAAMSAADLGSNT